MNILDKIYIKDIFKRYLALTIGLYLSALNFNLLLNPINFVAGGTGGLAIIINHVFDIEPSYFIACAYIITFLISIIFLGKESLIGLLYATILYPIFVKLTGNIDSLITMSHNDIFVIAIFSGIISGISNGLIYKNGFPSSGLGVIAPIIQKYFHISISLTNFVINTSIVILGGYYFGLEMILYAVILLYLNSYISNIIILGVASHKAIMVRSKKLEEINEYVYQTYHINATILNVHGGYNKEQGKLSLIVIPTYKYSMIKNEIKKIDKAAFFVTYNSYELKSNSLS